VTALVPAGGRDLVDFSRRAETPELMDADDLPIERYRAVLHDLARVNIATRAAAPTLHWLDGVAAAGPISIVDVGFGQGDMLRAIARWAQRREQRVSLHGVDINPRSAPIATAMTNVSLGIHYHTGDAATIVASMDRAPDVIISSLVAHHMTDPELAQFIQWMEQTAQRGWFINDLHRHPLAWRGYQVLAALMRVDPIVRHDGALSVRRAFVRSDWERLLVDAAVPAHAVTIRWSLPFRWAIGRRTTTAGT
jgi:2-polyprenyl-3-methyl-5-hydroxy-6-metoxy-1,4-benzoquinol methylase